MTKRTRETTMRTGKLYRSLRFDRASVDAEARTVELAFSSETPVPRWAGNEILDHAAQSIRLDRLNNAGAVLLDHDPRRQIGVVESVTIGDDRVGRAVVRFGSGPDASVAFQDVQDGIRQHVSVGYFVHRMTLEDEEEGEGTYRVTDWEPFEISIVAIPADTAVGVGRAAEPTEQLVNTVLIRTIADVVPTPTEVKIMAETQVPTPAEQERARAQGIIDLGETYARYVSSKDAAEYVRNGRTPEQFKDHIMAKMESQHADTRSQDIGMTAREVQRYSFARALQAAVAGDWSQAGLEREASLALAKSVGRTPEGFYVPFEVWRRDFNVGTTTEAGNLVGTSIRPDLYVDALRNALVMARLGARVLVGLTDSITIPRKATASSLGTLTEIGSATESAPTTAGLGLSPKRVGAFIEVSKQAIIQSALSLEGMMRDDLLMGAAVQLENLAINGNGTSPQHAGIRNTTGRGTVVGGTNGLAPAWSHFVDLESACANSNAEPDALAGYLLNTKTRGKLKQTVLGTNLPFIWTPGAFPVNGYRALVSNNVPSNLTKGTSTTVCSAGIFSSDWSMEVLAFFGAPDITVDPYTKADTGQVKITLNQFADSGVRLPAAFATIDDMLAG